MINQHEKLRGDGCWWRRLRPWTTNIVISKHNYEPPPKSLLQVIMKNSHCEMDSEFKNSVFRIVKRPPKSVIYWNFGLFEGDSNIIIIK
jgi:hypothetical protein